MELGQFGFALFGAVMGALGSIPGKVLMLGLTGAVFYHLANGVRHLVWDAGEGFGLSR